MVLSRINENTELYLFYFVAAVAALCFGNALCIHSSIHIAGNFLSKLLLPVVGDP